MHVWLYTWLPRFFGCHQKGERSFHYTYQNIERQFPICARCTGELIGIIFSITICFFYIPPWWVLVLLLIPMIVDGFAQQLTSYVSNNFKRVVTGFLFGYAICALFILSGVVAYEFGAEIGRNLLKKQTLTKVNVSGRRQIQLF